MKRYVSVLLAIMLVPVLCLDTFADDFAELKNAKASAVYDCLKEEFIYENNSKMPLAVASTTKIMTSLLALEEENIDEEFTVSPSALRTEGSSMGLLEGDRVTLRTLALGMMLPSGNDAANAAAFKISGSREKFLSHSQQTHA